MFVQISQTMQMTVVRTNHIPQIIKQRKMTRANFIREAMYHAEISWPTAAKIADGDTDIMLEFDPIARSSVYDYVDLRDNIASLFDGPVDVVNRDGLKPTIKPAATHAF